VPKDNADGEQILKLAALDLLGQKSGAPKLVVTEQRVAATRMRFEIQAPFGSPKSRNLRHKIARALFAPIDEMEEQRQRREQLVVLPQMLLNDRIVLVWNALVVEVVRPSGEDLLRPLIEHEPRKPVELSLDRAPFNRIEVR
jgi:hypothetical protein